MSKAIAQQFSSNNIFKFLYTCSYLKITSKHEGNFQGLKYWKFWHTIFFLNALFAETLGNVCTTTVNKHIPRNTFES